MQSKNQTTSVSENRIHQNYQDSAIADKHFLILATHHQSSRTMPYFDCALLLYDPDETIPRIETPPNFLMNLLGFAGSAVRNMADRSSIVHQVLSIPLPITTLPPDLLCHQLHRPA